MATISTFLAVLDHLHTYLLTYLLFSVNLVQPVSPLSCFRHLCKERTLGVCQHIGFLSNGRYSLSWLPLPTKSYTLVLRHICLNASIPTFLLAACDHPPLICTSLALISISVHVRFILQLQQSGILSLSTLRSSQTLNTFQKHLKTHLFPVCI